jgi:hypothetical protein
MKKVPYIIVLLIAVAGPLLVVPSLMATPKEAFEYRTKERFLDSPESFRFDAENRKLLADYISRTEMNESISRIFVFCLFPVLFGISIYGLIREVKHNNMPRRTESTRSA